ncbi:MAG: MobQ family relaxase [Waltera sp.]
MALFHLSVTQTKRSAGQSAIASAAYRAGERLYSEYYGEYSDYTRKGGVICSDILLPSHAPPEYADRQTLWNAVEKAERGKNAQLAYSFDIALQNEFSLEENIALARQFLLENFVSRGMVVDFAVHQPDREDGGIPNPHFHVLCPIRPIEQNGKWGLKQRRVYELDEDGNRIRDADGKFVFNAVPTTDWGSPETLEHWREAWAEMCNAKFAEKGLDVRIDHRSYERQGVDLLPTIHEGATVRAMEKKGIRTEKGEFNRWIKATNAVIKDIRKKISLLFDWITEIKAELAKPQTPDLVSLLNDYYTQRKAGAYSQKGKISNLKEMNETYNYLRANGIYTLEDLESRLQSHRTTVDGLKTTMDSQNARMKAIRRDIPLTLADERIARAIRENNAKLVIIDPVQAFLGADVDMNRANEVRPIFRSLGDIAQATGCAIVLIGHLNKAVGTQSTYRGLGSIDITAAVRSLLFIGKLKDNPTTRVLIHEKSSLAPPGQSLAFSLGDEKGFEWIGAYDITADELPAGTDTAKTESKTAQAEMLILELLANGKKMPSAELEKAVNDRGISSRTMRTAKSRIGDRLITEKDGTAWVCYLRN